MYDNIGLIEADAITESNAAAASESEAVGGGTEGSIQSINTTPSAGA